MSATLQAMKCPDCGESTTNPLCDACTTVAAAHGLTVDQRLAVLNGADTEDPTTNGEQSCPPQN